MEPKDLNLDDLCSRLEAVEERVRAGQEIAEQIRKTIVDKMEAADERSVTTLEGRKVTVVQSTTKKWDEVVLKDVLVALGLWDRVKVVQETFDKRALETLIDSGQVPAKAVLPALEVKANKPFPRITPPKKAR